MTFASELRDHITPVPPEARLRPSVKAAARAYDLLQAALIDYRPFADVIAQAASGFWGRPRMLELWCGTGVPTWDVLSAVPSLDYHGVDPVPEMVQVFRKKTVQKACRKGAIDFATPADPSVKATPARAYDGTADIVVLCRALQSIPLAVADGRLSQTGVLRLASELLRENGKLFVIEEIYGASAEEQESFHWAADDLARQRLLERHTTLVAELEPLEPDLADLVRRLPVQPALVRDIRTRANRFRDRYALPLSVWYRILSQMGFNTQTAVHPALPGLHMFTLSQA